MHAELTYLNKRSSQFARLWQYSVGFYGVWIAHIGRELKLFHGLAERPMTAEELSVTTGLNPAAIRVWCSAARAYRFLTIRGGKLGLNHQLKRILVERESPEYLGGQFSYLALRSLGYGQFKEFFKSGKSRNTLLTVEAVQQATDWDHYALLTKARRRKVLHDSLSKSCRVLDVGCGTGGLMDKIYKAYPNSRIVGVDPSRKALSLARQVARGRPITLRNISAESMKFADEFDTIFLCESLYMTKDKEKVISNCWQSLKHQGVIAIVEGLLPESKHEYTVNQLIMGMQLDFALQGHRFMTKKEIRSLLKPGFSKIRFQELGGSTYLVTAIKNSRVVR